MTCARARTQIAGLDARESPSRALRRHIDRCADCRRVYERLRDLEAAARTPIEGATSPVSALDAAFTARVMDAVRRTRNPEPAVETAAEPEAATKAVAEPAVGLRGWTAGGAVILAGLVVIQFSDVVDWLRGSIGPVIDVALATMLGVALTIYILMLVGSNLIAVRRALRWLTR
jgi:hypothetical protein